MDKGIRMARKLKQVFAPDGMLLKKKFERKYELASVKLFVQRIEMH